MEEGGRRTRTDGMRGKSVDHIAARRQQAVLLFLLLLLLHMLSAVATAAAAADGLLLLLLQLLILVRCLCPLGGPPCGPVREPVWQRLALLPVAGPAAGDDASAQAALPVLVVQRHGLPHRHGPLGGTELHPQRRTAGLHADATPAERLTVPHAVGAIKRPARLPQPAHMPNTTGQPASQPASPAQINDTGPSSPPSLLAARLPVGLRLTCCSSGGGGPIQLKWVLLVASVSV